MRHRTTYTYDDDVTDSLGVARLVPRSLPGQRVGEYDVRVTPAPIDLSRDLDYYGNHVSYFQVTEPHAELVVEGSGRVDVEVSEVPAPLLDRPWESLRPLLMPGPQAWAGVDFALASPLVEQDVARAYAAESLAAGRPVGEAVTDLMHRVHADFEYDPEVTTVTSTVADVLRSRAGVCQDFAHLVLACLRSHGLAARYVSGYLATDPPPGRERVVGADASHAWVEVWLGSDPDGQAPGDGGVAPTPGAGGVWLALDPTNDVLVGDRYVTVAWGRDYGDVPPLKGVIFTEAKKSTLQVSVDVAPLEEPGSRVLGAIV